jgi:pyruvate formate lyase activating enzyme
MKICDLCPRHCAIPEGGRGVCRVRMNVNGAIVPVTFGKPCALHVDPMEKKPLFHFHPGEAILSVGTAGCNLTCKNCQNADISQGDPSALNTYDLPPATLPELARREGCSHLAYTYTEPLVGFEYVLACCKEGRAAGLSNVIISAGYINEVPLAQLIPFLDAVNLDIKAFSDDFYRTVCGVTLEPVLAAARQLHRAGVHLEITNLVIPTLNDSDADIKGLCGWIASELGPDIPLHLSRFFPCHRLMDLPPTPTDTLLRACETANDAGLRYVYIGNVGTTDGETTFCPSCDTPLIRRVRYRITENRLSADARCPKCVTPIYGRF